MCIILFPRTNLNFLLLKIWKVEEEEEKKNFSEIISNCYFQPKKSL